MLHYLYMFILWSYVLLSFIWPFFIGGLVKIIWRKCPCWIAGLMGCVLWLVISVLVCGEWQNPSHWAANITPVFQAIFEILLAFFLAALGNQWTGYVYVWLRK